MVALDINPGTGYNNARGSDSNYFKKGVFNNPIPKAYHTEKVGAGGEVLNGEDD